jgi:hypothetical protein
MENYTLLNEALQLGGKYVKMTDDPRSAFFAFQQHANGQSAHVRSTLAGANAGTREPLSTAHISPQVSEKLFKVPQIEFYDGASIFKASRGGVVEQVGGGLRGDISGFSYASRRRLMVTIGKIKRDAELPLFVTLTYPNEYPADPAEWKRHLDMFFKRLKRKFPNVGAIWKMEPQERGAAHYHLLAWGCPESEARLFVPAAWYEIAGGGDPNHYLWHIGALGNGNEHCVQPVRSFQGVMSYASKYLGKTFEVAGWENVGRFWGVVNRGKIPFGEKMVFEVTKAKSAVVMRYQRRFMRNSKTRGLKKKITAKGKSMTIFCDASQWANRLL